MPETGYNEVYDRDGNVIESIPFEVSDDQLLARELKQEANSYHILAMQAYRSWGSLTPKQKDRALKFLLGFYLTVGERLGYFVV